MAFSKIILNGVTQIDLTQDTTQADKTIQGYTGHQNDGTGFTGNYVPQTGDDVPTYTITFDENYDIESITCDKTFSDIYNGDYGYAIIDDDGYKMVCDKSITGVSYILWTHNLSFDLRHNSDESITIIEPSRYALTLNVSDNGTYTPSSGYAYTQVNVNVPASTPTLQSKTATPTESIQTITPDSGYDGLSSVQINAVSSTYVGSEIGRKSSTDLTASGATITAPAGYYSAAASKSVASGTVTAPASISGTSASVSTGTNTITLSKAISVTPSVSTAGYVSAGTAGNSAVSLTASVTTKAAATITPGTSDQTIAAGTYLTGA